MYKHDDYPTEVREGGPEYGDFLFNPMFGYFTYWDGKRWVLNEITEEDGSVWEIVRLTKVPPPEEFELVMQ